MGNLVEELLTLDQIAAMYHVSRRFARDVLVKQAGFPPPVTGSTKKNPLWFEDNIREFMSSDTRTNNAQD